MQLSEYLTATQRLLSNTASNLFPPGELIDYINEARKQVAADGYAIRRLLSLATVSGTNTYAISSISVAGITGAESVLIVRKLAYNGNTVPLTNKPWDWFYNYCAINPQSGNPTVWSQLSQGAAGTLYLWPTPASVLTLAPDCVILPADLVNDTSTDLLSFPWDRPVKYYAAYLAYLSAQRQSDAQQMLALYTQRLESAKSQSTSTSLPRNFPLSGVPSALPTSTPGPYLAGKNA